MPIGGFDHSQFLREVYPISLYVLGAAIYVIFIWHFYKNLGKRDIFKLDLSKYGDNESVKKDLSVFLYVLEYIIFLPFITFFWFIIMAIFLFILSNTTVNTILIISITLVATIRIAAYYKEELAVELGKILPFTLLAIFVTEPFLFSRSTILGKLGSMLSIDKGILVTLFDYLIFIIILEIFLRIIYSIFAFFRAD